MEDAEIVKEAVTIASSELSEVTDLAAKEGVSVEHDQLRTGEPISTIVVVLLGSAAAVGAVSHAIDRRKGGHIIDLRRSAAKTVYRTPDVVYGLIVIIASDGTVTIDVKEPKGILGTVISSLVEALGELMKQDAGQVADTARRQIGRIAEVDIQVSRTGEPHA